MRIMDIKDNLHDRHVLNLLAHSQYMPTEEKLKGLADTYESDPNIFAFSCVDNSCNMGVVVLKRLTMTAFEIVSIDVAPAFRGQGIGSKLISFAVDILKCDEVSAETDDDAVGFYRSYGFDVVSLGEKYPGVIRYLCTLEMDQLRKFDIKPLNVEDINPGLLNDFSHVQKITKKYVRKNEVWEISDVSILREWSGEKRIWITKYMCQQIERGGLIIGAFSGVKLIGFCCMDGIISGDSAKYVNLTMLFVDDNWKGQGIGKQLFKEANKHAVKLGAEKIFISAIPSIDTIAFYQKIGCTDACEVVESFVDSEDDRYMEFVCVM